MATANRQQVTVNTRSQDARNRRERRRRSPKSVPTSASDRDKAIKKAQSLAKREKLTQAEIAFLWIVLGGAPSKALEASAISMAESSGIVKNGNYCCHGIWAIHLEANGVSLECAQNPICATRWAIKTEKELGWNPWTVYTGADTPGGEKTYKRFMPGGEYWDPKVKTQLASFGGALGPLIQGFAPGAGGNPIEGAQDAVEGIGDLAGVVADIAQALFDPDFWVRVGKVLIGTVLIFMAANALMKALFGVDLTDAVPSGKIAKAAKGAGSKAIKQTSKG